ncbi:Hypothetical predicted protein, partial [Marmota monax]
RVNIEEKPNGIQDGRIEEVLFLTALWNETTEAVRRHLHRFHLDGIQHLGACDRTPIQQIFAEPPELQPPVQKPEPLCS